MIWIIVGLITAWGVIDAIYKSAKEVGTQTTTSGVVYTVLGTAFVVFLWVGTLIGLAQIF